MKKTLIVLLIIIFFSCSDRTSPEPDGNGNDIIEISGSISGVLEYGKGTYKAINTVYVDSDSFLVIEAGVKIIFADSAYMIVNGNLKCQGTKERPVVFTSISKKWKGLKIINAPDTSIIEFCKIENVHLSDTDSLNYGAVGIYSSNITIKNTIFEKNYAFYGGGIYAESSSISIYNSLFITNTSVVYGGAILLANSNSKVINNTFYDNLSHNYGGAIAIFQSENSDIQNNIFYKNRANDGYAGIYIDNIPSENYLEQYNFFENDTNNPNFVSESDCHLSAGSPCIDAGNPGSIYNDSNGSRNDQGAYGGPGGNW